ncbi:hypothetical protein [Burkholderia sp. F1]|uniref:hypothetical protein n=1 Tax=Burkholderia sp. F1 TaxID=3366817 RepID=UPI003D70C116
MTRAKWYVAGYVALLLGVVGTLSLVGKGIPFGLDADVFKVIATLVGTGLFGVFAPFAINELNRQKERRDAERAMRRIMLADLITAYNDVKAIRRSLRAEAIRPVYSGPSAHVLKQRYLELLPKLNEAQLRLESFVRLIDGNKLAYPGHDELLKRVSAAEKYLGALISEWENKSGLLLDAPGTNALADFPMLHCFVADASQSFGPGFANPIGEVLGKLAATLAK